MVVKKPTSIMRAICGYYNGYKKSTFIMRTICRYCNGCKKTNIYYESYMWVLQWL